MLFRSILKRCSVTLANGTVLNGKLNPNKKNMLLEGIVTIPGDGRIYSGSYHPEKGFPLPGSRLEEEGDLYKGSFNEKWQRDGEGEAWLEDGTYYKGTFKNDELVKGTVRIPNGTSEIVFNGELKNEEFVRGTLKEQDFTYEGEFKSNQPHGKGKLVFTTGAELEGTFHGGKLHGVGCKMKLDSGFVYVGDFLDGAIQSGTLYTPTYTYEGEFNSQGRAHGEGSQTYLNNEPRLTFTGIWNNGAMVRGACVDEYGSPVDWQNDHKLQAQVMGDAEEDGDAKVAANNYFSAKVKEADALFRDMSSSYAQDAEKVAAETGKYPSKMDLGYEGGIQAENDALQSSQRKQMQDFETSQNSFKDQSIRFDAISSQLKDNVVGELNESMAKIQFSRQAGAQELSSQRVDEQFERFLKSFDRPSDKDNKSSDLNVDKNAPWKSFTSTKK